MNMTDDEKIKVIQDRITKTVTAGSSSGGYLVVDPEKLSKFLFEQLPKTEPCKRCIEEKNINLGGGWGYTDSNGVNHIHPQ